MTSIGDALNSDTPEAKRERRRLYLELIDAIALNDGPGDGGALSVPYVSHTVSVGLVAMVFGKTDVQVARSVVRVRKEEAKRS